jgi:hypothetical protein
VCRPACQYLAVSSSISRCLHTASASVLSRSYATCLYSTYMGSQGQMSPPPGRPAAACLCRSAANGCSTIDKCAVVVLTATQSQRLRFVLFSVYFILFYFISSFESRGCCSIPTLFQPNINNPILMLMRLTNKLYADKFLIHSSSPPLFVVWDN